MVRDILFYGAIIIAGYGSLFAAFQFGISVGMRKAEELVNLHHVDNSYKEYQDRLGDQGNFPN